MILLVLSPIAIVLLVMGTLQMFHGWSVSEQEIENMLASAELEATERSHQNKMDNSKSNSSIRKPSSDKKHLDMQQQQQQHPTHQDALVLTTEHGKIRIVLRPDLSPGSVSYIYKLVESGVCKRCNFYRSEKPGILQGVMANPNIPVNDKLGPCPEGLDSVPNDCPEWDKNCGCHGPIMTKGAVGWAAGQAGGPDFFIDHYPEPAKFWGTQHTNFGRIQDAESFVVIGRIFDQPIKSQGMMSMLEKPIHFDLSIEPMIGGEIGEVLSM